MKIRRGEGLNIVPFIDIMLVLLAIVLSVSTFIAQGKIEIDLPQADSAQKKNDDKKVSIVVDANNVIYVDDKPESIEALKSLIEDTDPKTLVELRSDKDSKFETFVKIIDLLKENNHENFAISTKTN
ncbi:TonB system transport protein ExbD [Helicobacter cappadocius]|uniref:Biopolymer transport protein ExbD n=1 Tax=Helicobacter cappadocius TaxID=3063998 RepID=A0AA90TFG5_9HELI|nr:MULTISPECIES: TonB system transport protein ExbD [unclassified Helicobacter]MDO7253697.1 TonB system transport protein ExbD [Helicobacter sp. faydin-H75]MDP2539615.1 TonB system transport protein ExbD [Helicobacter sp. faydin-H76]